MKYDRTDLRISRTEFIEEWVEMLEQRWKKKDLDKMYTSLVNKWEKANQ